MEELERIRRSPRSAPRRARPLFACRVAAGFPSPADDYLEKSLDLNEHLVKRPASTFFVRAEGESMLGAGIHPGDLLVVDRAIEPEPGRIVIAALDGELLVKRLCERDGQWYLASANRRYPDFPVGDDRDLVIWGVVTHVIHAL